MELLQPLHSGVALLLSWGFLLGFCVCFFVWGRLFVFLLALCITLACAIFVVPLVFPCAIK